jgi:superfamily I DNA/RNA helicase
VLIVAGAGSGKTRALTHRIAYLIREEGVAPGAILAITFTNKAAHEMADRVEGLLGARVAKGMWILTFHSMCARLLRREHNHLGLPSSFTIYDDGDTERLIGGIVRDLDLDPKRFPPRAIASAIGRAKDQVIDAGRFAQIASNFYEETVAKVYAAYESRKLAAGALDFDDLIMETVRLFRDHPDVLRHYQERFRYLAGGEASGRWEIPVAIRAEADGRRIELTHLLRDAEEQVVLPERTERVVVNAGGHGFYRVAYAPELLQRLEEALPKDAAAGKRYADMSSVNR